MATGGMHDTAYGAPEDFMKQKNKIVWIIAVAVLAAGYGLFYLSNRVPFAEQKPAVGDNAPALALADTSGNMVNLADYRGKVVLINFWASWCPPCKAEMPGFQRVLMEFEGKGFAVLSVSLDDVSPAVLKELNILFPVMKLNERVKMGYGNVSDVPQSFLIDREGRIIKKVWKVYDEKDLGADVKRALGGTG